MTKKNRIAVTKGQLDTLSAKFTEKRNILLQRIADIENESERFRAEKQARYFYIDSDSVIMRDEDLSSKVDDMHFASGNYYQTEEQAKLGPEYFHANSEFTFWHPGMESRPKERPEGCEAFVSNWVGVESTPNTWNSGVYRWPKSSPVEWVKS